MKKLFCFILSFALLLSFSSCRVIERFQGDMGELDYNADGALYYGEKSYRLADDRFFVRLTESDTVAELGWYSQFPFFPDMHFYAFDEQNPSFIFCDNQQSTIYNKGLYFRSDYDLYNSPFIIENTDILCTPFDAMTKSSVLPADIDSASDRSILFSLQDDPRVKMELGGPYNYNGEWYLIHAGEAWLLSDELVSALGITG